MKFKRTIPLFVMFALLLASCAKPDVVAIPVTQGPTLAPPTTAPVAINAPKISSPSLVSIRMMDEKNGWGIDDTHVVRTDDGGTTWYNVTPQGATQLGYSATYDFLDELHGWVLISDPSNPLVGTLYRTADGGVSWKTSTVNFTSHNILFIDQKNGWAMADLGAGAGSMGIAVYQTTDGGDTWTQTYTNDPNQTGAGDSLPLGGIKDGMSILDMKTAWIGGVTYSPGTIYLYQTKDAGHTWALSPVPVPNGYEQAEAETIGPQVISPTLIYLPLHLTNQYGVMLAVYVSRDGGQSWIQTPTLIPQGGTLDFVSDKTGFIWNGTTFYVTNDGAQTWSTVTPDVAFGENFADMDFVSATTGFVLTNDVTGTRTLYKTTDGGATWNVLGK